MRSSPAVPKHRRTRRILSQARGYRGGRSKLYRVAKQQIMKAGQAAYMGRKQRKRTFRSLWIARINGAVRGLGLSYSQFMDGIKKKSIMMNRKQLSELAINNPESFLKLVNLVKE